MWELLVIHRAWPKCTRVGKLEARQWRWSDNTLEGVQACTHRLGVTARHLVKDTFCFLFHLILYLIVVALVNAKFPCLSLVSRKYKSCSEVNFEILDLEWGTAVSQAESSFWLRRLPRSLDTPVANCKSTQWADQWKCHVGSTLPMWMVSNMPSHNVMYLINVVWIFDEVLTMDNHQHIHKKISPS